MITLIPKKISLISFGYELVAIPRGNAVYVIGHGIGGKHIPIMARLAKARRWSKR